jgi:predicted permease
LKISWSASVNIVLKILAQPLVMWLLAVALGVTGVYRREMILLGALPTASMTAMFAVQYKVYIAESDATILFSTIVSIVTLGICIALTV